jgi:hypothetical protein
MKNKKPESVTKQGPEQNIKRPMRVERLSPKKTSRRMHNGPIGPGLRSLEVRITRQGLVCLTIGQMGPPDKSVCCLYVS